MFEAPPSYVPPVRDSFITETVKLAVTVAVICTVAYAANRVLHHLFDDGAGEGSDS